MIGQVESEPLGTFDYDKWMPGGFPIQCRVQLFALEVEKLEKTYPESSQRRRKWFGKKGAVARVQEQEIKELIAGFSPILSAMGPKCLTERGLSDIRSLWFHRIASFEGDHNGLDRYRRH